VRRNILKKASLFDSLLAKLTTLDPKAVLRRGYSIVYKPPKEKAITGVEELQRGDLLRILLARGEVAASVEDLASKNR
jgi:exodeoxyribonuclease VII large subunit